MSIAFQQGIVQYPIIGNDQQFLSVAGSYVTMNCASGITEITFAHLHKNYSFTETTTTVSAWGPFFDTEVWLYWDIDLISGARTFGHTAVRPVYGILAPINPEDNQHWFDSQNKRMMVFSNGRWITKIRVFACKKIDSTFYPMGTDMVMPFAGTQVGLISTSVEPGYIIADNAGNPIKKTDGTFFTTTDTFVINGSPVKAFSLEGTLQYAQATENISSYQVVKYSNFGQVSLALYDDVQNVLLGITTTDIPVDGEGPITLQGVISNPTWNWTIPGAPLWVHPSVPGLLTEVDPITDINIPRSVAKVPVARVLTATSIYFSQGLGGKGDQGVKGDAGTGGNYVPIEGATLTGFVTAHADPVLPMHIATKQYVDGSSAATMFFPNITSSFAQTPVSGSNIYPTTLGADNSGHHRVILDGPVDIYIGAPDIDFPEGFVYTIINSTDTGRWLRGYGNTSLALSMGTPAIFIPPFNSLTIVKHGSFRLLSATYDIDGRLFDDPGPV
jgi:hypothetical protein